MKQEMIDRIIKEKTVDTRTKRYVAADDSNMYEQYTVIKSIDKEYLNTTASLNDESDTNPNGWHLEWSGETSQADRFDRLLKAKQISSQNELAKLANCNQKTINNLCSGRSDYASATHSTLMFIADALGMSIDQLDDVILEGKEPEKRYIVETDLLDNDGCINYATERKGFNTKQEALDYCHEMETYHPENTKWIVYDLDQQIYENTTHLELSYSNKIAGEKAVDQMSKKAQKVYNTSDPIDIYTNGIVYSIRGIVDRDNMSFKDCEQLLEELAD